MNRIISAAKVIMTAKQHSLIGEGTIDDPIVSKSIINLILKPNANFKTSLCRQGFVALSQVSNHLLEGAAHNKSVYCRLDDDTISRVIRSRDLARCILLSNEVNVLNNETERETGVMTTKRSNRRVWVDTLSMPYEIDINGEGLRPWRWDLLDTHIPSRYKMRAVKDSYAMADYTVAILDDEASVYLESLKSSLSWLGKITDGPKELVRKLRLEGRDARNDDELNKVYEMIKGLVAHNGGVNRLWLLGPYEYWNRAWTAQEQHSSKTIVYMREVWTANNTMGKTKGTPAQDEDKEKLSMDEYVNNIELTEILKTADVAEMMKKFGDWNEELRGLNVELTHVLDEEIGNPLLDIRDKFIKNYEDMRLCIERAWEILAGHEQTSSARYAFGRDMSHRSVAARMLVRTIKFSNSKGDLTAALSTMLDIDYDRQKLNEAWKSILMLLVSEGCMPFPNSLGGIFYGDGWRVEPKLYCNTFPGGVMAFNRGEYRKLNASGKIKYLADKFELDPYAAYYDRPSEEGSDKFMVCSAALTSFLYRNYESESVIINQDDMLCFKNKRVNVRVDSVDCAGVPFRHISGDNSVRTGLRWKVTLTLMDRTNNYISRDTGITFDNSEAAISYTDNTDICAGRSSIAGRVESWLLVDDLLMLLHNAGEGDEREYIRIAMRLSQDQLKLAMRYTENDSGYVVIRNETEERKFRKRSGERLNRILEKDG